MTQKIVTSSDDFLKWTFNIEKKLRLTKAFWLLMCVVEEHNGMFWAAGWSGLRSSCLLATCDSERAAELQCFCAFLLYISQPAQLISLQTFLARPLHCWWICLECILQKASLPALRICSCENVAVLSALPLFFLCPSGRRSRVSLTCCRETATTSTPNRSSRKSSTKKLSPSLTGAKWVSLQCSCSLPVNSWLGERSWQKLVLRGKADVIL